MSVSAKNNIFKYMMMGLLVVLALPTPILLSAEQASPQVVMTTVTNDLLGVLRNDQEKIANDATYLDKKVRDIVLPNMDFISMSKLVLKKHWLTATTEQREQFVEQFTALLVHTYTKSLTAFSDEKIEFLPFKAGKKPEKLAVVKSLIVRSTGADVPLNYRLRYKKSDGWKVYDIAVEGVSLVTNYRSSFAREIAQKGIDHLIKSLTQRNQSVGSNLQG